MGAEGFINNFDVLYGGLGIGKLQFLIQKKFNFFSVVIFYLQFLVIKAMDPDPDEMNADLQLWFINIFAAKELNCKH